MAHVSTVLTRPASPFSAVSSSNSNRIVFKRDSLNGLTASVNNVPVEWVGPNGRTPQLDPRLADQPRQNLRLIPVPGFDDKPIRYTVEVKGGLLGGGGCISGEEGVKSAQVEIALPSGIKMTFRNHDEVMKFLEKTGQHLHNGTPPDSLRGTTVQNSAASTANNSPHHSDSENSPKDSPKHDRNSGHTPPSLTGSVNNDSPKDSDGKTFVLTAPMVQVVSLPTPSATPVSNASPSAIAQDKAEKAAKVVLAGVIGGEVDGFKSADEAIGWGIQELQKTAVHQVPIPLRVMVDLADALAVRGKSDHLLLARKEAIAEQLFLYLMAVSLRGEKIEKETKEAFEASVGKAIGLLDDTTRPENRLRVVLETARFGIRNLKSSAPSPYMGVLGDLQLVANAISEKKAGDLVLAVGGIASKLLNIKATGEQKEWYEQIRAMDFSAAAAIGDVAHLNTLQSSFIAPNVEGRAWINGNEHTVSAGLRNLGRVVLATQDEKIQKQAWEGQKDQPLTGVRGYLNFDRSWYSATNASVRAEAARSLTDIALAFKDGGTPTARSIGREAEVALIARRAVENDPRVKTVFDNHPRIAEIRQMSQATYSRSDTQAQVQAQIKVGIAAIHDQLKAVQEELKKTSTPELQAELKQLSAVMANVPGNLAQLAIDIPEMKEMLVKVQADVTKTLGVVTEIKADTVEIKATTASTAVAVTDLSAKTDLILAAVKAAAAPAKDENPKVTAYVEKLKTACLSLLEKRQSTIERVESTQGQRPYFLQVITPNFYRLEWTNLEGVRTYYIVSFSDKSIRASGTLLTDSTFLQFGEIRDGFVRSEIKSHRTRVLGTA